MEHDRGDMRFETELTIYWLTDFIFPMRQVFCNKPKIIYFHDIPSLDLMWCYCIYCVHIVLCTRDQVSRPLFEGLDLISESTLDLDKQDLGVYFKTSQNCDCRILVNSLSIAWFMCQRSYCDQVVQMARNMSNFYLHLEMEHKER